MSQRGCQARPSQQAKGCLVFPGSRRGCHRHHLHCVPSPDAGTEALSQLWRQSHRPICPSRSDVTWWEFPCVLGWGQGNIHCWEPVPTAPKALGADPVEVGRAPRPSHPLSSPSYGVQGQLGPKPLSRDRFPAFPQREAGSSRKNRVSDGVAAGSLCAEWRCQGDQQ